MRRSVKPALRYLFWRTDMKAIDLELPPQLADFVRDRVQERRYRTVSEYLRDLIQADQDQFAAARLKAELVKGLGSGDATEMTAADWQGLRKTVTERGRARTASNGHRLTRRKR